MDVQTTLNYCGRTEEAVSFYNQAIDAEVLFLLKFREGPEPFRSKVGLEDKVFHSTLRIGSTLVMASDCGCESSISETSFSGFSLALRVDSPEKAERYFSALSDGGIVQIPMSKTVFAEKYGIVLDRFGVSWKVMLESRKTD